MEQTKVQVSGYRWVVLILFMLTNAMIEVHWLNFAAITTDAATFYGVTPLKIGYFSVLYMVIYLVLCIPASYVIDTFGLKTGVGLGAVLMAVFGMLKAFCPESYWMVFTAYVGLAVAQPFIMNAMTKVGANWFPLEERGLAAGLAALSQYIGIIFALAATPFLVNGFGMEGMLMIYGVASVVIAAVFLLFCKDKPDVAPALVVEEKLPVGAGLKHIFSQRDMIVALILFFIGLGMFNAVTTWLEQILAPRGLSPEQAGIVGGVIMLGGIIGAVILPLLSDKTRRRKPFLIATMVGMLPGLLGITFCTSYPLLLISGFVMGFFIMAAGPIGFQYAAEVSYPAPESTSQGLILLSGQISGIIFIYLMDMLRDPVSGSMTPFMIAYVFMSFAAIGICFLLRESPMILSEGVPVEEDSGELVREGMQI